jgi:AraC-like DNA-binding protein
LPAAFVRSLPGVLRDHGVDPSHVLQSTGLPADTFDASGRQISYPQLEQLFGACARAAACDHVGLLIGRGVRLDDFGMAAGSARLAPTLGAGLGSFVAFCNLHDTAATARLDVHEGRVRFACAITDHGLVDTRHFDYLSVAITCAVLQELCGPDWKPVAVRLASPEPSDRAVFASLLGGALEFDASCSEVEFDAQWLERPLPPLEPATRAAIATTLHQARAALLADLPTALRRILRKRLLLGDFSMDDVAAQLSMHRRTLDRRLQRCATTYGELLEAVRDDIARQLLRDTHFSIQRVAEAVRFSSAANFATAFRRRTGMTPTEYRRAG